MTDSKIIALSRFRADIARSLQRHTKKLLVAKNIAEEVQALEPLELYYRIKEIGLEDGFPLMLHAKKEQFQVCIDLDCWQKDTLSLAELDAWLSPFASLGAEGLAQAFFNLDEELQTLYLAATLDILEAHPDGMPDAPEGVIRITTPDGFFYINRKQDFEIEELELEPFAVVHAMYKRDVEGGYRLMMAALHESYSDREEQAYQFKAGRLQDLGFPYPEDAMKLFAKPKATQKIILPTSSSKTTLPAVYAVALNNDALFVAAAALLSDAHVVERIETELMHLINTAVVAYGENPKSIQHASFVAERVRDTLSLGLEKLLGHQDAQLATDFLIQHSLFDIFRHGYQTLVPLWQQANVLLKNEACVQWLAAREEDMAATQERADKFFVNALVSAQHLVHAGFDKLEPNKQRPFATLEEVDEAKSRLMKIAERFGK